MVGYNPPKMKVDVDYIANPQASTYSGIDNVQLGVIYARVADVNALRIAVENLRTTLEALMEELR